jgi:hypothetical protein
VSLHVFAHLVFDALANLVAHLKKIENDQLLARKSKVFCQRDLRDPQLILPKLQ